MPTVLLPATRTNISADPPSPSAPALAARTPTVPDALPPNGRPVVLTARTNTTAAPDPPNGRTCVLPAPTRTVPAADPPSDNPTAGDAAVTNASTSLVPPMTNGQDEVPSISGSDPDAGNKNNRDIYSSVNATRIEPEPTDATEPCFMRMPVFSLTVIFCP